MIALRFKLLVAATGILAGSEGPASLLKWFLSGDELRRRGSLDINECRLFVGSDSCRRRRAISVFTGDDERS